MKKTTTTLALSFVLLANPMFAATFLINGPYDAPAFEYEDGAFEAEIHDETADVALDPDTHIFQINQLSTTTFQNELYFWIPTDEAAAANNNVPYVGIGLEELSSDDWVDGTVEISLNSMNYTGPAGSAQFVLWSSGGPTGDILRLDSDSLTGNTITSGAGSHIHYNWGFSEEGTYELNFGISGTHVDDGFKDANQTYTFQVVPEPSSFLLGAVSLSLLFIRRR